MIWFLPSFVAVVAVAARAVPVGEEMSPSTGRSLVDNSGIGIRKYISTPNVCLSLSLSSRFIIFKRHGHTSLRTDSHNRWFRVDKSYTVPGSEGISGQDVFGWRS